MWNGTEGQSWIKAWYLAPKRGHFSCRMYRLRLDMCISDLGGHRKFLFIQFLGLPLFPFSKHCPQSVVNSLQWNVRCSRCSGLYPVPGVRWLRRLPFVFTGPWWKSEPVKAADVSVSSAWWNWLGFEPKRWWGLTHPPSLPCSFSQGKCYAGRERRKEPILSLGQTLN